MSNSYDLFSMHEALDRTHVVLDTFYGFILEHPFVQDVPELKNKATSIANDMYDLYQMIGNITVAKEEGDE